MFYIGLCRENMDKSSCLKLQGMKIHVVSVYDQEIPPSQTADKPVAS